MRRWLLLLSWLISLSLLSGCTSGRLSVSSYGGDLKEYRTFRENRPLIALLRFLYPPLDVPVLNGNHVFGDPLSELRKQTFVWINHGVSGVFIEE